MIEQKLLGKINTDSADRDLEITDIKDALNLVPQIEGKSNSPRRTSLDGMMKKVKGMHESGIYTNLFELPSGTNTTVGQFEDKSKSRVYFFNHNSNNDHGVYVYIPKEDTIATIIISSILAFTSTTVIAGAGIIDETLVFTDGTNQIRSIHVQSALNTENENSSPGPFLSNTNILTGREFLLVFDRKNIIGKSVSITLNTVSGNDVINLSTITSEDDIDTKLDYWVNEINYTTGSLAERCGDTITLSETAYGGVYNQLNSVTSSDVSVLIVAPTNFFLSWTERNINLINQPPQCEPSFIVKENLDIGLNFIDGIPFQFRSRNVYYDNTVSTLSPISGIAFSKNCATGSPNLSNYIEVQFHDAPYTEEEVSLIKDVELFFRDGNDGAWFRIESLSREEYFTGKYDFYNDGNYVAVSDTDSNKMFDSIPDKANSLTILKNRLFIGGVTEGRETPCVDAKLDVTIDDVPVDPPTWTIEGYIRIANSWNAGDVDNDNRRKGRSNQVIWNNGTDATSIWGGVSYGFGISNDKITKVGENNKQFIPRNGFTVFLAGTSYQAVSKQVYDATGALNNLDNAPYVFPSDAGDIRDRMEDYECFQKFSITGVKPGRYIMRVASHLVYDADELPVDIAGYVNDTYQINTTNLWQETSTHLRTINEPITANNIDNKSISIPNELAQFKYPKGDQEMVLELGVEGGVHEISDSVIVVDDLCFPSKKLNVFGYGVKLNESAGAMEAYIFDTEGGANTSGTDFSKGLVIPDCDVQVKDTCSLLDLNNDSRTSPVFKSDHNGYFYSSRHYSIPTEIIAPHVRSSKITSSGREVCGYSDQSTMQIIDRIGPDTGNNIGNAKKGNINGDAKSVSVDWEGLLANGEDRYATKQVLIIAQDGNINKLGRTQITGTLLDINGLPISNALITLTGSNETRTTNSEGQFSLTTYAQTNPDNVKIGALFYHTSLSPCLLDSDPLSTDKIKVINISIDSGNYNNQSQSDWYFSGTKIFGTVKDLSKSTFLKRGGVYQYGVVYYDDYLRSSLVSTQDELKVKFPFYTEDLHDFYPNTYGTGTFKYGDPKVDWELKSTPPDWATRYKWVRTKNSAYNEYLHWVANEITYMLSYDIETDTPTTTLYATGDAKEIYISLENILTYKGEVSDSKVGYTFQNGDRVVLVKNNGIYYTTYYDLEIREQRGNNIVIEALGSYGELKEGLEIHIYTPKLQVEDDIYYEISGCFPIVNGLHTGLTQDQTSSVPAKGYFVTGDTYKISRIIPTKTTSVSNTLDSQHITDSRARVDSDIGRPNTENNYFKQEYRFGTVRFSNPYVQGSFVDGIKTFDALDEEILPFERGIIRKMVGTTNTILVIHETESTSLYISESFLHTAEGSGLLTTTDKVIGKENLLKGEFGTRNPESVVEYDDTIYWWDENKSEPIRYSNNGLTPLAYNLGYKKGVMDIEDVRKAYRVANTGANNKIYGGYDPIRNIFMLTFADLGDGNTNTIAFHEDSKYWVTRLSHIAQHYTKLANELFSFNNGELWQHDVDSNNPNTFYGVHYDSEFTIVSNVNPSNEKIYRNVGISTNNKWDVVSISNSEGQLSSLVKGSFIQRDNMFYADILRDENTNTDQLTGNQTPRLHGHVMRSQVMEFRFVTDQTGKLYVEEVFIGLQSSPGHLVDNSQ